MKVVVVVLMVHRIAAQEGNIPDGDGEDDCDDDDDYVRDEDDDCDDNEDMGSVHDNGVFLVIQSEQYTTTNIQRPARFTLKYQPINSEGRKGGRQHRMFGGKSGDDGLLHKLHSTQHFHAIPYQ